MKQLVELLKNVVASTPLILAIGVGYIAQPILYVAKQLSNLGVFAHEKLQTSLGQQITKKRVELRQQMEILQRMQQQMQAASKEESTLANTIKNNNTTETPVASNVFVLGRKDDNGNKS